jgi:hypothetical protein
MTTEDDEVNEILIELLVSTMLLICAYNVATLDSENKEPVFKLT